MTNTTIMLKTKRATNPAYESFFCICETCGSLEFLEQSDLTGKQFNELLPNGDIRHKNSYLTSKYDSDFFCDSCAGDSTLIQIPFSYADKKMRKMVANMKPEERLKFIERYKMIKALEDEDKSDINLINGFVSILFREGKCYNENRI